jgi:energy-coupling factor transport system ATP-binding protein
VDRVRSVIEAVLAGGRSLVAISHDMRFVAEAFDRIVVLRAGRVIADGTPAAVFGSASWDALRSSYLEPPFASVLGQRLGLGSTPTDASLISALGAAAAG